MCDDKKNSSSWILKNWLGEAEDRVWGKFFNLYENEKIKLKELIIHAGKGMSLQRHFNRDEIWFVSKGKCDVKYRRVKQEKQKIETLVSELEEAIKTDNFNSMKDLSESLKKTVMEVGEKAYSAAGNAEQANDDVIETDFSAEK